MSVGFEHRRNPHHRSPALEYSYNDWSFAGGGSPGSSSSSYETSKGDSWNGNSSFVLGSSNPTSLTLPHLRHHHHSRNHGSIGGATPLRFSGTNNMFSFSASNSSFPHDTISEAQKHTSSSSASGYGKFGENETFSGEKSSRFLSSLLEPSTDQSQLSSHPSSPPHWVNAVTNRKTNFGNLATHSVNYNGTLDKAHHHHFGHKMDNSTTLSSSLTDPNISHIHYTDHTAKKSFTSTVASSIEQLFDKSNYNDIYNSSFRNLSSGHNLPIPPDLALDVGTLSTENSVSPNYYNITSSIEFNNETAINATNATAAVSILQGNLYATILPIMLFFCVLAVIVNLLIVISARWCRKPMSPTLYFSISLALADAYAAVVLAVGLVINSLLPVLFQYKLPMCFSLVVEAFRQGGILVTVCHLLALAMNHWIGIVRPLHYAATMTRRTAWTVIIFSWICPITMIFIYYSCIRGEGFQSTRCETNHFLGERAYRAFFASCFFAPLILMSFIYIHIFIIVRNHHTHRQRYQVKEKNSQQLKRNVKAVLTTMLVLGTYIIGWMPATLYSLIACKNCIYNIKSLSEVVRFSFGITCNLLVILKTLVDPIIYAARMSDIQMALKRMRYDIMSRCCKSCAPPAPPNDRGCSKLNRSFYDTKSMRMSSFGSRSNSSRRMNNTANASMRLNANQMNPNNHPPTHKQLSPHNGMMTGPTNGYLPCATEIQSLPNSNVSTRRSFVQGNQAQPLINSKSAFEMTEIN